MLRHTLRRFIADRVVPYGDAWEEQGFVPREVLREMGSLGLLGMRYAPEHGGAGPRHARQRRAGRGARTLHLRRLCGDRAGAHRHGLAAPLSRRHARAARALDARHHRRPQDHGGGHDGGRRRLRPRLHAHHRAQGRRRLRPERRQDVHHQRRARRPLFRRRQDRRGRPQPAHHDVRRREGRARLPRRPRAEEARLAVQRHGRAGVRGLLRAGRESDRRGRPRLLRAGARTCRTSAS